MKGEIFNRDCRVGSAHSPTNCLCSLTPVQRPLNAMGSRLSLPVVEINATVVVNIFTLEIAVEDINTEGEAKGLKTAHETLLDKVGWTRPYCFGGAVQKGKFRPVSGFLNGLREGYKAVTEPGYAGHLTAYGTLAADLEAFKRFTKLKENREKAQIPEEAVRVALHLAASREHGLKKSSFSMDPLLHAEILEYLCSFEYPMYDPNANQQMLQKVLAIKEQYFGEHHWRVALTLNNLAIACAKLKDPRTHAFLDRALNNFQEHFGEDHFTVAKTLVNIGNAYHHLGEYEKARDFWDRSRLIAKTWENLVNVLSDTDKAKDVFERVLKIQGQHCDQDQFEPGTTLTNLANVYGSLGDQSKEKELLEWALKIDMQHYGTNHYQVAITLTSLGAAYMELGDHDKAKDIFERALNIKLWHFGEDHIQVAITLHNLAMTHGLLGEYEKAAEILERVLLVYEDHFGAHRGRCNDVRRAIDWATRSM